VPESGEHDEEVMLMKDVVIVSGLPRSGTSMMMRMLEEGGLGVLVDGVRQADEDNPRGYYEFEPVKEVKTDTSWLGDAEGRAVKMVSMLLYDLPGDRSYRVILMRRDLEEILASQRRMLERTGQEGDMDDAEMRRLFTKHMAEVDGWLGSRGNFRVLPVAYADVITEPRESARRVNEFLGGGLDEERMARVVDSSLYRQKGSGEEAATATGSGSSGDEDEKARVEAQLRALGYM
jgi:hypothetical protein